MFSPPVSKEKYYYHAAKRFMMDAQLLRCRAAIHVEDKDDIVFWSNIFKHFLPGMTGFILSRVPGTNGAMKPEA